jgi:hypothetical protein
MWNVVEDRKKYDIEVLKAFLKDEINKLNNYIL